MKTNDSIDIKNKIKAKSKCSPIKCKHNYELLKN